MFAFSTLFVSLPYLLEGIQHQDLQNLLKFTVMYGCVECRFKFHSLYNLKSVFKLMLGPQTMSDVRSKVGVSLMMKCLQNRESFMFYTYRYFSGSQVITKAVRNLRKGELVPENYGQSFASKIKTQRKAELADRYWFECNCEVRCATQCTYITSKKILNIFK